MNLANPDTSPLANRVEGLNSWSRKAIFGWLNLILPGLVVGLTLWPLFDWRAVSLAGSAWLLILIMILGLGERLLRWVYRLHAASPSPTQAIALESAWMGIPQSQRPWVRVVISPQRGIWAVKGFGSRGSVWVSSTTLEELSPNQLRYELQILYRKLGGSWCFLRTLYAVLLALVVLALPQQWKYRLFGFPSFYRDENSFFRTDGVRGVISAAILFPYIRNLLGWFEVSNFRAFGVVVEGIEGYPFCSGQIADDAFYRDSPTGSGILRPMRFSIGLLSAILKIEPRD